jgi:phosphate transport system ATP-binding protein
MLDVLPQRENLAPEAAEAVLETRGLSASVGGRVLLRSVDLRLYPRQVLGIVGPSGAGKTTLLRCLNRLTDLVPGLAVSGEILLRR